MALASIARFYIHAHSEVAGNSSTFCAQFSNSLVGMNCEIQMQIMNLHYCSEC